MRTWRIISAAAMLAAVPLAAGCGAEGVEASDGELVSTEEQGIGFLPSSPRWDPANCNTARTTCFGMHCCGAGEAMTGAHVDLNDFQCRKIALASEALEAGCGVFTTTRTIEGVTLRACPPDMYMRGHNNGNNTITCCPYPSINKTTSFTLDGHDEPAAVDTAPFIKKPGFFAGTCKSVLAHVCPPGSVMEGIHVTGNWFLCGT